MKTKDEVLDTIAGKYGHADWATAKYREDEKTIQGMLLQAMDDYAETRNSHKPVVMQTLPFSFVEWYSGMQRAKIESAYKRWMKEGNVAVASSAVGSQTCARPLCKDRCDWPNCTLDRCIVHGEPRG